MSHSGKSWYPGKYIKYNLIFFVSIYCRLNFALALFVEIQRRTPRDSKVQAS